MALTSYITHDYVSAANRLRSAEGVEEVVAYVESYDDVAFWSQILRQLETPGRRFRVMLPSCTSLAKGKKIAMDHELGPCLLACVDADYDWLMQGTTDTSRQLCSSPYVIHTHAYAIENIQCYAEALREVCVQATLNDRPVFDFVGFLRQYSEVVWPLFVWNVWAYRYGRYKQFSLSDFAAAVELRGVNLDAPQKSLDWLRRHVNQQVARLQQRYPEGRQTWKPLREQLLSLGLTPQTTYLYMRGHDLFDALVLPLLDKVCERLRREREREIMSLACHERQRLNELQGYRHACSSPQEMLRKHTGYQDCPPYRQILESLRQVYPVTSPSL